MLKKKIISDSIVLYSVSLLTKLKGLVFLPIIIGFVGIENYGAFVQILVNVRIISPISALALGMGFLRYCSKYDETDKNQLSRDYWTVFIFSIIFGFLGVLIAYFISQPISKYILKGISLDSLRLSSILILIEVLWTQNTKYLKSRKKFKIFSGYELTYNLVPYIGFVVGIVIKKNIFFGLLLYILSESTLLIILVVQIIKDLNYRKPSLPIFKKYIKYSWPLTFSSITGGLLSKVDRYFIGFFIGPAAIGIYNIIYSAVSLLDSFSIPFRSYFGVYMPKHWDKGAVNRVKNQLKEGLLYYLIISFGTLIFLSLYIKPLVLIIFKAKLSSIQNIELLVFITGIGIVGLGSSRFYYQVMQYQERNHLQLVFYVISLVLNIILNYFLIPIYGILGAGFSTFFCYFLIILLSNRFFSLDIDSIFISKIIRIFLAVIPAIIIFKIIPSYEMIHLLLSLTLNFIVYILFIFFIRVLKPTELKSRFT
ncbi:MAG: lipopolysaccharide biosynthesis protein [Promethearchaeota archaeon]